MNNIFSRVALLRAVVRAGRFVLHFVEMSVAMIVGMMLFMAIPGVMELPRPLYVVGMAISMTVPMVAWMRIRGHGWRHGIEMSVGMLVPWIAVLAAVALGAASVLPWLEMADGPAMFLGMLAVMLLRPGHHAHGAHHQHAATHPHGRELHRFRWRRLLLPLAYLGAFPSR